MHEHIYSRAELLIAGVFFVASRRIISSRIDGSSQPYPTEHA
jgi:hypothetical protein